MEPQEKRAKNPMRNINLDNALLMGVTAETIGTQTGAQLRRQREQMNIIEEDLLEINDSFQRSSRIFDSIKSIRKAIANKFWRKKQKDRAWDVIEARNQQQYELERERVNLRKLESHTEHQEITQFENLAEASSIIQVQNQNKNLRELEKLDPLQATMLQKVYEKKEVENGQLDELTNVIRSLRLISEDIGFELDIQEEQISRIESEFTKSNQNAKQITKEIQSFLNS